MGASGSKLRVGLVGCGIIAESHAPYVRKAGGEIVGVADASLVRANDFADRFQVQRIYGSVDELVEHEGCDVVHVLTPPHTHADVAIRALERGVHTLVEKPVALRAEEVVAMGEAARRGGALLTADHNRLFDPPMLEARRLVEEGALGELVAVESYQAGSASERQWLGSLAGGGIGDLIPHPLYLQLAFLGEVEEMVAHSWGGPSPDRPEELRVLMRGRDRSGVLTISMNASPGLNTLKLCGTKATVEVNLNNMTLIRRRDYAVPKIVAKPLPNIDESAQLMRQVIRNTVDFLRGKVRYYPGMGELIARFYAAVRNGGEPPVTVDQAAQVVRVTERIWESVRSNGAGTPRVDPAVGED